MSKLELASGAKVRNKWSILILQIDTSNGDVITHIMNVSSSGWNCFIASLNGNDIKREAVIIEKVISFSLMFSLRIRVVDYECLADWLAKLER